MDLPSYMNSGSPIDLAPIHSARSNMGSESPVRPPLSKHVAFELLFPESPQYKARLPLRVQIFPHDSTESIVTTVKNFYGLYSGPTGSKGISFEDDRGNTLIAGYENFRNNMVVYVRIIEDSPQPAVPFLTGYPAATVAARSFGSNDFSCQSAQHLDQHHSRPASRTSRKRSVSPNDERGRSSMSTGPNPAAGKKGRSRSSKTRGPNYENHSDSINGYSSDDNNAPSVSSKAKEPIGNTDISLENIVEGGRRKRAKFESSVSVLLALSPPANLHSMKHSLTLFVKYRNFHYSRRLRCRLRLPTRLFLLLGGPTLTVPPFPSPTRDKIPSPTPDLSNLLNTMVTVAIATSACMPRLPLTRDVIATVLATRLASCQLLIPRSAATCLRRTKMSPCSL